MAERKRRIPIPAALRGAALINRVSPADRVPEAFVEAIITLSEEISLLRVATEHLSASVAALHLPDDKQHAARRAPRGRAITDTDAKAAIKAYFEKRHGETVYPSEIADELHLDYDRALRLIGELESDGQVTKA
jgi:hypothetical protein